MLVSRLILASLLLLAACSREADSADDATTGDAVAAARADARDAAIVALRVGDRLCTGVVIGPRTVLTSRGCATGQSPDDCVRPSDQTMFRRDDGAISVITGEDAAAGVVVAKSVSVHVPDSPRVCGADLARVELDADVPGVTPLVLGTESIASAAVRVVGYGARKTGGTTGIKASRRGLAIAATSATELTVPTSACAGDEGAPVLDEKTNRVLGVASRWSGDCGAANEHAIFTRVDAFTELLAPPEVDGGAGGAAGRACSSAHHCPKGYHCDKTTHACAAVDGGD